MTKVFETFEGLVVEADKPNINGFSYPEAVLRKAVEEAQQQVKDRKLMGRVGQGGQFPMRLREVSHVVTSLEMKGKRAHAQIEILNTPEGQRLGRMLKERCGTPLDNFRLAPVSVGTLQGKEIHDAKLQSVDFVSRDDVE